VEGISHRPPPPASRDPFADDVRALRAEAARCASHRHRAALNLQRLRALKETDPAIVARIAAEIRVEEIAVASWTADLARLNREGIELFGQGCGGKGDAAKGGAA